MPTLEINYSDLQKLVGKHVPLDNLRDEAILYAKAEIDGIEGETLKVDSKDTNRPDLWSTEGIAREIRFRLHRAGMPKYRVSKPTVEVKVDQSLRGVRPLTVCAVVRGLDLDEDSLSQMIQLQEKVSTTFGRNRRDVAIGAYDLHNIKPPIRFTTTKPDGIMFTPLDSKEEMTPEQILEKHPKGREYAHLLKGKKLYPIFVDSADEVLSMPPIINSDHTGKVTTSTSDIFIECSGYDFRFLIPALNVISAALADRGGNIEGVRVYYPKASLPKGYPSSMVTPDMGPRKASLEPGLFRQMSGMKLSLKEMVDLLSRSGYDVRPSSGKLSLSYPAYRQDIMHQRDIIEDMLITYGYNRIELTRPMIPTMGSQSAMEAFSSKIAMLMQGLGMQEIMSYILTNKDDLYRKMCMEGQETVEIGNPVSSNWSVFRTWLLPGLLELFSKNKNVEYPQKVFEIGEAVLPGSTDTLSEDRRKMAFAITDNETGYQDVASALDALMLSLGISMSLEPAKHPSFIPGRCATVNVKGKPIGHVGEIHPAVLESWGLEKPVSASEIDMGMLMEAYEN